MCFVRALHSGSWMGSICEAEASLLCSGVDGGVYPVGTSDLNGCLGPVACWAFVLVCPNLVLLPPMTSKSAVCPLDMRCCLCCGTSAWAL